MRTSTGSGAALSMAAISSGVTIGITSRRYGWLSLRDDHRDGDGTVVAERQVPAHDPTVDGELAGTCGHDEPRRARRLDLDPGVVEPERPQAEPERLHHGL